MFSVLRKPKATVKANLALCRSSGHGHHESAGHLSWKLFRLESDETDRGICKYIWTLTIVEKKLQNKRMSMKLNVYQEILMLNYVWQQGTN